MDVIRYLLSRPTFAEHLVFAPAKVYTHRGSNVRVYSEMYTGNWWWRTQVSYFRVFPPHCLKLLGLPSRGFYHHTRDYRLGLYPSDQLRGRKKGVAGVHESREYSFQSAQ
jgi:hypothetical protein